MSWSISRFVAVSTEAAKAEVDRQYAAVKQYAYMPAAVPELVKAAIDLCGVGPEGCIVEAYGHKEGSHVGNIQVKVEPVGVVVGAP